MRADRRDKEILFGEAILNDTARKSTSARAEVLNNGSEIKSAATTAGLKRSGTKSSDASTATKKIETQTAQKSAENKALDPTRYGDWEKAGRCIDF